jgi:hypothetical protein
MFKESASDLQLKVPSISKQKMVRFLAEDENDCVVAELTVKLAERARFESQR